MSGSTVLMASVTRWEKALSFRSKLGQPNGLAQSGYVVPGHGSLNRSKPITPGVEPKNSATWRHAAA